MTVIRDGAWVAYYHDWSGFRLFGTELECLRHAVEHHMSAVRCPFGEDPRAVVAKEYQRKRARSQDAPTTTEPGGTTS